MADRKKLAKLSELDEKGLREEVLLPLLTRLGCKAPTIYHGPQERGKDIITYTHNLLGQREYVAIVAKATDLTGSVSSSQGIREVIHQVQQCFDTPYEDLFGMNRVSIDRVWIVTSKRVLPSASTSIFDSLEKSNLKKLICVISGEQLATLLDENYPAFWDESLEPVDLLRDRNARLTRFCQDLLSALGGTQSEITDTINAVFHSHTTPNVTIPPDRTLTRLSPYQVEFESIPEPYMHRFQLSCGSIREAFFEAKKKLYYATVDVEEFIESYEEVMEENNPKDFVETYKKKLCEDHPFFYDCFRQAQDADDAILHLDNGLTEFMELQTRLKRVGRWEWAIALIASVSVLAADIESLLQHAERDDFTLYWLVDDDNQSPPVLRLEYTRPSTTNHTFVTHHTRNIVPFGGKGARPATVSDITDEVRRKITEHLWKLARKDKDK